MKKVIFILGILALIALMVLQPKAMDTDDYVRSIIRERGEIGYVYFTTESSVYLVMANVLGITKSGENLVVTANTPYELVDCLQVGNSIATQAPTETILASFADIKQIYSNTGITLNGFVISPMDGLERRMTNEQAFALATVIFIGYLIVRAFKFTFD